MIEEDRKHGDTSYSVKLGDSSQNVSPEAIQPGYKSNLTSELAIVIS
jgi:hypothetical protein